jgi:hypothetical protein
VRYAISSPLLPSHSLTERCCVSPNEHGIYRFNGGAYVCCTGSSAPHVIVVLPPLTFWFSILDLYILVSDVQKNDSVDPLFSSSFFFCEENDPVYNSWKMILITQHICPLVYFNFDFGEYLDQRCSEKWLGWICFLNKMILCIIYIAENGTDSANKWIFISWMLVKSEICKGIDSLHILSVASHCILYCLGSSLSSVRITNLTLNAEQHHAWSSDNDPYRPS